MFCAVDNKHKIHPPLQDRLEAPYITTDRNVSASYIALSDAPVAETREAHDSVLIDVDASGEVVGIEVFGDTFIALIEDVAGERGSPRGYRDVTGRASEAY